MRGVDLSDVPPLLRAETRRRIRTIRQYLSPTKPKGHTAGYFANRLGMSEAKFRALVATWRKHQKASKRPGATHVGGHPYELEGKIASVVDQIGAESVPGARFDDIMRRLRERCAQQSLTAPPRAAVARHLAGQRAKKPKARPPRPLPSISAPPARYDGPPVLLVDHLDLDLAVFDSEGLAATTNVTLAVLLPEQAVVAHFVSTSHPTPQSAAQVLLKTLGCETIGTPARGLIYEPGGEPGWAAIESALISAGISINETEIAALLDAKADLRSELTQLLFPQPEATAMKGRLLLAQATARIGTAIDRYNQRFRSFETGPSIPPFAITRRPKTAAARARLAEIARQRPGPIRARSSPSQDSKQSQ